MPDVATGGYSLTGALALFWILTMVLVPVAEVQWGKGPAAATVAVVGGCVGAKGHPPGVVERGGRERRRRKRRAKGRGRMEQGLAMVSAK